MRITYRSAWALPLSILAAACGGDTAGGPDYFDAGADTSANPPIDAAVDSPKAVDAGHDTAPAPDSGPPVTPDAGHDSGSPAIDAGSDTSADANEDGAVAVDAGTDAHLDAGKDGGTSSGADAATDAEPDATTVGGTDAGPDARTDSGTSSGTDAGPDGAHDGGPDTGHDSGTSDAGNESPPWYTLVNASPDLGPVGLCISAGGATPPLAPNVIPPGAGRGQPFTYPGFDLTSIAIQILAIPAGNIPATGGALDGGVWDCDALTRADAGTGWMTLGTIAKGTFSDGSSYIAAITGCLGGDSSGKCGAGYTDAGTLGLTTYEVDNTTKFDAGVGIQFLQLSTQWEAFANDAGAEGYATTAASVTFNHAEELDGTPPVDAGATDATIPADIAIGEAKFGQGPTAAVGVLGLTTDFNSAVGETPGFIASARLSDGGSVMIPAGIGSAVPDTFGLSTHGVQMMSFGPTAPDSGVAATPDGGYLTGGNWTVILLGDFSLAVEQPDGGLSSEFGPRILAMPNYPHN